MMNFDPENSIQILAITGVMHGNLSSIQFEQTIFNISEWISKDNKDNLKKIDLIPSMFLKLHFGSKIYGLITTQPRDYKEKNDLNIESYKDSILLSISVLQSDYDFPLVKDLFESMILNSDFDYSLIEGFSGLMVSPDKNLTIGFSEGSWRKK